MTRPNNRPGANYLNGLAALFVTKEGLTEFVEFEITQLHADILKNVTTKCTKCTTENLLKCPLKGFCKGKRCKVHDNSVPDKKPNQPCPHVSCTVIRDAIINEHRFRGPSWKNTDARKWCNDPFQIAKCFMPPDGYSENESFDKTDFNGTLSVIINCKWFEKQMTADLTKTSNSCTRAREVGKAIRHSSKFEISDNDIDRYIDDLQVLLQDIIFLANYSKATQAVNSLNEVRNKTRNKKKVKCAYRKWLHPEDTSAPLQLIAERKGDHV